MPSTVAWMHTHGERPNTVTAYEREHGGIVYLKWYENRKTRKRSLGFRVRGPDSKVRKQSIMEAKAQAKEKYQLLSGQRDAPEPSLLTLERGYEIFLTPGTGRFATLRRDIKENSERLKRMVLDVLGPKTVWGDLHGPNVTRRLTRTFADRYHRGMGGGVRQAERAIGMLFTISSWLHENEHVADRLTPPSGWRRSLKEEWKELVGESTDPSRPRYSNGEFDAFVEVVYSRSDPDLDVRGQLLFVLGIGQRVEQVLRIWRSGVEPESSEAAEFGRILIPGTPRKPAGWMHLTEAQQAHLLKALNDGYLAALEAAFKSGEITDFPIFPSGMLKNGRSQPAADRQPLNRSWALKRFLEIEALAGIEHVKGRGFRALRRSYSDLTETHAVDELTKSREQGWDKTSTRRIYQDRDSPRVLEDGRKLRDKVLSTGSPPSATGGPVEKDLIEEVQQKIKEGRLDPQRLLEILASEITDEAV